MQADGVECVLLFGRTTNKTGICFDRYGEHGYFVVDY